jgi:hypothetical protein
MSDSAAFCLPTSDMVMRAPNSAVLLLALDMFEVSSNEGLLVRMRLSPECRTQVKERQQGRQILTAYSFGCHPRLSTSALLILLVVAEGSRHHSHMQVAVHSVNHCAVWTRPSYVCAPRKQKWVYEKCRNSS